MHVAPGSYSGAITTSKSGTASARIAYLSDTKWGAKLTNPTWSVAGSYVTVEGFDLTGPTTSYAFNVNALDNASGPAVHHVILKQNYIHDFMTSGCASTGIIQETPRGGHDFPNNSHDNTYDGNIIRHVGSYNSGVNGCVTLHGFYLSGPGDRIINNESDY